MSLHHIFAVEMSIAKVASESPLLFVSSFDVFLQIVIECCFVSANMTNFEIALFGMAISHVLLKSFLKRMCIITLIAFPWFLGLMFVHYVLLHMFVVLK